RGAGGNSTKPGLPATGTVGTRLTGLASSIGPGQGKALRNGVVPVAAMLHPGRPVRRGRTSRSARPLGGDRAAGPGLGAVRYLSWEDHRVHGRVPKTGVARPDPVVRCCARAGGGSTHIYIGRSPACFVRFVSRSRPLPRPQ